MKRNARSNKRHAKPAPKNPPPELPVAAPPAAPPLSGEALEQKVAETMCAGFRETEARAALRAACNNAEDSAIEAAIVSPRVKSAVEPVSRAFALEHSVDILRTTFCKARSALTSDKPTPAEILALKIVVQIFIEKMMERIEGNLWQESFNLLGFSDYEKGLIENLIQLKRGLREPADQAPQSTAEICASAAIGE